MNRTTWTCCCFFFVVVAASDGRLAENTPFSWPTIIFTCSASGPTLVLIFFFLTAAGAPVSVWLLERARVCLLLLASFSSPPPFPLHAAVTARVQNLKGKLRSTCRYRSLGAAFRADAI
ncbi:unnamed protein product, partial [Pylaiella littoralis]